MIGKGEKECRIENCLARRSLKGVDGSLRGPKGRGNLLPCERQTPSGRLRLLRCARNDGLWAASLVGELSAIALLLLLPVFAEAAPRRAAVYYSDGKVLLHCLARTMRDY